MSEHDRKSASHSSSSVTGQRRDSSAPETLTPVQQDKVSGGLGGTEPKGDGKIAIN